MEFATIDAHLYSINMIKGERIWKTLFKFDDGSLFTFTLLKKRINGIIMGERVYNYYSDLIIKDYKNKVECINKLKMKFKMECYLNYDIGKLIRIMTNLLLK